MVSFSRILVVAAPDELPVVDMCHGELLVKCGSGM
jgi:hypothetical protein